MKLLIRSDRHDMTVFLPTGLVCSRLVLRKVLIRFGAKEISPQMARALAGELRKLSRRYGTWKLVEAVTADGEEITVLI